ncbi:MAG: class II aldolase/adducin family protein [Clostridia bacterium]|nr:class II aldolase/adducin family protein [Clostridia bacterium]
MWSFETSYKDELSEIIKYSALVYWRRLVSAAGGNISMRCGDNILITASDVSLREVTADGVILCDMDGNVLEGNPSLKPSKETRFHLSIYHSRPGIGAVIHAHPCYSTAFSLSGKELPLYTVSAKLKLSNVPIIGEAPPGSAELAENVHRAVSEDHPDAFAYLMRAHGILTMGRTMKESFDLAELLEDTAKIAVLHKTELPQSAYSR